MIYKNRFPLRKCLLRLGLTSCLAIAVCPVSQADAVATDDRGNLVGEPRLPKGQTVLENEYLSYSVTPALGGRGLAFAVPGYSNLLLVGQEVMTSPEPVIAADGENYPYLGHIVWIGPQIDWWRHQSLNAERRDAGAVWPPDPYTVLVENKVVFRDETALELAAPASPVTGLQLNKRYQLDGDTLVHQVEATNTRSEPVAWDIWFNTRVRSDAHVFVPVRDFENDFRLETFEGDEAVADVERMQVGYFDFKRGGSFKAKAFIQPSAGWIAAFSAGQLFVIEFELQAKEAIHSSQGQVELYLDTNPESGLLELEVHAPYMTLKPGEAMAAAERWHAWPSDASTLAEQLAELRRRGYSIRE